MDAGHEDRWQNGNSSNATILFSIHFNNPLRAFITNKRLPYLEDVRNVLHD